MAFKGIIRVIAMAVGAGGLALDAGELADIPGWALLAVGFVLFAVFSEFEIRSLTKALDDKKRVLEIQLGMTNPYEPRLDTPEFLEWYVRQGLRAAMELDRESGRVLTNPYAVDDGQTSALTASVRCEVWSQTPDRKVVIRQVIMEVTQGCIGRRKKLLMTLLGKPGPPWDIEGSSRWMRDIDFAARTPSGFFRPGKPLKFRLTIETGTPAYKYVFDMGRFKP